MKIELKIEDGKIFSHARNKWLVLTPEEMVRQEYLIQLINIYGYNLDQIDEEVETTGRGSGGARADFIIWKSADDKKSKKSPLIIVECKAENITLDDSVSLQGELYARQTNAPFFVTHNKMETRYWRVRKDKLPGYREEIEDIPKANSTEKEIEELLNKLKVFREHEFADLLHQCHNIIRNREKLDPAAAFDEIAKILFMKVFAERNLKADMKGNIFTLDYIEQGERFNPDYIFDIFEKTKLEFGRDRLFKKYEKINLKINTIKSIIEKLERYNLSATSTDVKGIAFEKFLGKTFRGEIGQFFTPRKIVEFMVDIVNPQENDTICDPASGSGGFLIRVFEKVRNEILKSVDEQYKEMKINIENIKDKSGEEKALLLTEAFDDLYTELDPSKTGSRIWKLSNRCIYGTDANERMARTSKMNMIMHGDGHGGIHHHDGFLNVNGIFEERFDIILTNPPFGQIIDNNDEVQTNQVEVDEHLIKHYKQVYGEKYEKSQLIIQRNLGKPIIKLFSLPKSNSIKTEVLFIERCLNLLKPGGKLGIVVPEGILNTPSMSYVREFTEDRAFLRGVVSLPLDTFASTGAKVKTSILFIQKFTEEEKYKWDSLISSHFQREKDAQRLEREKINERLNEKIIAKEKNLLKKRLLELDEIAFAKARKKAKWEFNYKILFFEATSVGINATGEEVHNELSLLAKQYDEFRKNGFEITNEVNSKIVEGLKNPIYFAEFRDLKKWTIPVKLLLNYKNRNNWPIMKISEFAYPITDKEEVKPNQEYNMVGVKWYGEGTFYRETVLGEEISAKWLSPLKKKAFIYNRLFAWKESFGIVPEEHEGFYVSNEFPQFYIDENVMLPEFLYFLFMQPFIIDAVKLLSAGSAAVSRNRFKEELFLDFDVPVPPIGTQRELVNDYKRSIKEAEELRKRAEEIVSSSKENIKKFIEYNIT
ncbi:N-6 DNA methylase [Cytobacillus oceanisediminis]|uniref:N-6 DNA methylase n=1 Tax=Cytobacillus oceanisediminis TaxID=665099 RepID=UPI00203D96CD|nr:N-6 DNA methylase [Cytobacillus oceanisediminis]MCM3392575.1 N-6 DNA methylase [Cytobacillus oceanisediminis]